MPNYLRSKRAIKLVFIIFLGFGVVAGTYLVQQQQETREKAVEIITPTPAVELDFEDPNYDPGKKVRQLESTRLLAPQVNVDEAAGVTNYAVVVAIEKQTFNKYPDAQAYIEDTIAIANNRMADVGILKSWYVQSFAAVYDKNTPTNCRAINPEGKYFPNEFCNHSNDYVYIIADETSGSNYAPRDYPSVEWHGYNGLFGSQGKSVLVHELSHILGLPDLYHLSISSANNLVNGEEYRPFSGYIMHNLTPGNFHQWDAQIVNRLNTSLPLAWSSWLNYQPQQNVLRIVDSRNNPLVNAEVRIYSSDPSKATGGLIDTMPEYSGVTDSEGLIVMGNNILGTDAFLALRAFLIEIKYDGSTDYRWLDITDVNFAYWLGNTQKAEYTIQTILGNKPTLTPTNMPTPTNKPTVTPTKKPSATPTKKPTNTPIVTSTPTPVPGDATGEGVVDIEDYKVWANNYNSSTQRGPTNADFDYNGRVDGEDYIIWLKNYEK